MTIILSDYFTRWIAWVTNITVLNSKYFKITLLKIFFATYTSNALKQSSIKYISASEYKALAIEILCFWPPDKFTPLSPTYVESLPKI